MAKLRLFTSIIAFLILILIMLSSCSESLEDGGLRIGWAIEDVTPEGPVSLRGQYYERISEYVQSPLNVTALAIESSNESGNNEQAIMISMDFAGPGTTLQDAIKEKVKEQIPDFNVAKLFLNGTHTHSAPNTSSSTEYGQMLEDKMAKVAVAAWNDRKPAGISRALGYAVVGHNRRVQYADGTTQMYGSTDREDYIGMEGPSDPGVDMLFCWDLDKKLTGIVMNVSCPSQVTEAKYYVSADYWGELRREMEARFSEDVYILPQCGAGGDISPRDLPRGYKSGEPNMWDVSGAVEIGRRLAGVIENAYPEARNAIQTDVVFKHAIGFMDLPTRRVSEEEYQEAVQTVKEIHSRESEGNTAWNRFLKEIEENEKVKEYGPWDNKLSDFGQLKKKEALVEKYKNQDNDPYFRIEVHAVRIGDVAVATNPFELYLDYGFRITGRSKAKQTFIVQLSSGGGGYLPTARALPGSGYSAMVNRVGPKGGQVLVNETVDLINAMWE